MHIFNFQLLNYKSFRESASLNFKPGFNIIVAQNNAGKTAFLEGLELNFENKLHKNPIFCKLQLQRGKRIKYNSVISANASTSGWTVN